MEKWHNLGADESISKLSSSKEGLDEQEVQLRLEKYGYNRLKEVKKRNIILKFIDQFKNVMIIILIIAAILSAVVSVLENEPFTDTIIIFVVVFLNALLGLVQESKAEKAIEALKSMSLPYIKVKRNGKVESIKTEELVIGDIVLVEAGDYVPADMRIIENHSLRVEEAALTGESVPVDKDINIIDKEEVSIGDRINMMYSGSSVVYGRGEGVVTATGMDTELGKIASSLSNQETEETPLQKKMKELSKILSILVIVISIVMFFVGIFEGKELLDVFMLAIALAVAAIPEGLAAVITITLAIGVQKMAKEKAIIRKLSAVEALGSTEVICSDKTGTLTQNKMTVRKIYTNNELIDVTKTLEYDNDYFTKVMVLCNDTRISSDNTKIGDPTETAIIDFTDKLNITKHDYEEKYQRIEELPFDSSRKMMTTINKLDDKYIVCTKGAIESILNKCNKILINKEVVLLTDDIKQEILNTNLSLAKEALRVLCFGYKIEDGIPQSLNSETVENDLTFVGLVGMIDPPRPEAKDAVKECFNAGMIPVMITGDNIDTAVAIAKELGIINNEKQAITGTEVDKLTDEELAIKVQEIRVYARVSPENKIRIVKAWKKIGKTVAMTGDGVNDAPALKGSDIGVGMGITGTEVSKSVSSMVLADDNFATIVLAVKEGRRIYTNIKNVIAYLLASNLAEIFIIFFATLFNKEMLLPIQILWINLVTDTIPAIALGFEKEEIGIMNQKPRSANAKFFDKFLTLRIIIPAIIKSIVVFVVYFILENMYNSIVAGAGVFVTLATIEMLFSFVCRSDKYSIFKIGIFSNKPMVICVVSTLILQSVILNIPTTREWLKVPHLDFNVHVITITASIISLILFENIKLILAKKFVK
jgi:P-type Ca2+ transporter type 2C